jgi:hypothetical protein
MKKFLINFLLKARIRSNLETLIQLSRDLGSNFPIEILQEEEVQEVRRDEKKETIMMTQGDVVNTVKFKEFGKENAENEKGRIQPRHQYEV